MTSAPENSLTPNDRTELENLVNVLELSDGTTIVFAVAPDSSPKHPVVDELKGLLGDCDEEFAVQNFFYSDESLHPFLNGLKPLPEETRRVVMAFGIDRLPFHRQVRELRQLNLGREMLFSRNLVLVFWLTRGEYLEVFRDRAPDFWDWREQVVRFETRPRLEPLLYPYLEWLIAENSSLKMGGIMQVQRQVDLFLDRVYVSLRGERQVEVASRSKGEMESAARCSPGKSLGKSLSQSFADELEPIVPDFVPDFGSPDVGSTKTVTEKVDLAQAIRNQQYSVILGDPGAGKTTLLRYLALHFATARRDEAQTVLAGEEREDLGQMRLPIFFRIADYAEKLATQPDLKLEEFLQQFYRQWETQLTAASTEFSAEEVAQLLCEKLQSGQCIVLLDGLDEVFDRSSRKQIVDGIEAFVSTYAGNKFVITSRIAGYREVNLSQRFGHFTITEMEREQVERFLRRWCLAVEQAQQSEATPERQERNAEAEVRGLLDAIDSNEGVQRLTGNPLLLTILALIHRNGSRLPHRRVELYALAVKTLTEDWQLGKKLPDGEKVLLKETEVVDLLAPLAYWMHEEKPSGLVSQEEVEAKLAEKLAELNDEEPDSPSVRQAVEGFLRRVRETTGLFVERAPGFYGFMHLTFEEYFAARYIADNESEDMLALIRRHQEEPRWMEPILLALGYSGMHMPKQLNKVVQKLFAALDDYQPDIERGEIQVKNGSTSDAVLAFPVVDEAGVIRYEESATIPEELGFAALVLAEVEVRAKVRSKVIEKLVLTVLGLDEDINEDTIPALLQVLRKIEDFNEKGETFAFLQRAIENCNLTDEIRVRAKVAALYIACRQADSILVAWVEKIINNLTPLLFSVLKELVSELGDEMTPALEKVREQHGEKERTQQSLDVMLAISYLRSKHYDKSLAVLENLINLSNSKIEPYISWSFAICYQDKEEYTQSERYYQQTFDNISTGNRQVALIFFWKQWGICYRLQEQYEKAVDCFQQSLTVAQEIDREKEEAHLLWQLGKTYQYWKKYEQAIEYHQQSRELYKKLEREENVANQWHWIGSCYEKLEQYEQAVECQQNCLDLRQKLNLDSAVALAYYQFGRIYQHWGKYEEAIEYHKKSRKIYQQLDKEKDVADSWYFMASCYREWSKYQEALDCELKDLEIRQQLDDQLNIALAYYQLGQIYQHWGKYEQAIDYFQKSRKLYQKLEKNKSVANRWYDLANCYREWGKYQEALDCELQDLEIHQQLNDQLRIALAYYQFGRIYKSWKKYEQAIDYFQQSRELYQKLEEDQNVANLWGWISDSHRGWEKYQEALDFRVKSLDIHQKLNNQSNIAYAYFELGRIYQSWKKYEQAIEYHQQSRELYQQLEKDVANQWYNQAVCYREWGKYQEALDCELQDLEIHQQLDDQSRIALAYYQLGRIHQSWEKYEEAIEYHQQSRELYQQLEKEKDVADSWYYLAACYRVLGKYQEALDCELKDLEIRQQLDDQSRIALAYYQLGRIYKSWGKYEQAIDYHQQSRNLYQQLDLEQDVANQCYWLGSCYHEIGQYYTAIEYQQKCLDLRQQLSLEEDVALAYNQLGRIYQSWGKYEEAIDDHQQSCELYQQLDLEQDIANLWSWLASCYRDLEDYPKAIEYYQQSRDLHQRLGQNESMAWGYRQIGNTQCLMAKNTLDSSFLPQAEQNIQHAIQLDTAGDYTSSLAYDAIVLALICAEFLHHFPADSPESSQRIAQFETNYRQGFDSLTQLGQTVSRAEEALDIARAYLEVPALHNPGTALTLTREALQTFQDFNRRKLQAKALKLLGEIHRHTGDEETARSFFTDSANLYRELDLPAKVAEVLRQAEEAGEAE